MFQVPVRRGALSSQVALVHMSAVTASVAHGSHADAAASQAQGCARGRHALRSSTVTSPHLGTAPSSSNSPRSVVGVSLKYALLSSSSSIFLKPWPFTPKFAALSIPESPRTRGTTLGRQEDSVSTTTDPLGSGILLRRHRAARSTLRATPPHDHAHAR